MRYVLQISAGRGPTEVQAFVGMLALHLQAHLPGKVEILADERASRLLSLEEHAEEAARAWVGVHALVAPLRGKGQRRRWFAAVSLHEVPVARQVGAEGIAWSASRAGGPGGQNVNKRATAVRAVDRATGLTVRAAGQRQQGQNRREAERRLEERIQQENLETARKAAGRRWAEHDRLRRGNPDFQWRLEEGLRQVG